MLNKQLLNEAAILYLKSMAISKAFIDLKNVGIDIEDLNERMVVENNKSYNKASKFERHLLSLLSDADRCDLDKAIIYVGFQIEEPYTVTWNRCLIAKMLVGGKAIKRQYVFSDESYCEVPFLTETENIIIEINK